MKAMVKISKMVGFSEFDAFRSNQIREGLIDREKAMVLVDQDNQPKFEMIRSFCHSVGLSFEETMASVEKLPRLY